MTRSHFVSPHLEFHRKQAKALLKAHAAGDPQALARFQQHHPRLAGASPESLRSVGVRLADAQLVLAREHGFSSWPRFQAHVREEATRQAQAEAAGGPSTHTTRPSILIVEAERCARETLADIFDEMGFEVVPAATAHEALDHIGARFFHVALLCLDLPDMSGTELLRRMKALHRDMIGIISTCYASVDAVVQALHARAFWFFEKPMDMRRVLEVVSEALKEQEETMAARRLLSEARGVAGVTGQGADYQA